MRWIAAVLCVICLAGVISFAGSSGEAKAAGQTGVVTAGPLNVRTGYGTSYSVLTVGSKRIQLAKGDKVEIQDIKSVDGVAWLKVDFTKSGKSYSGYVSGKYVSVNGSVAVSVSGATGSATVTEGPLNVRTGYGTDYSVLRVGGTRVQLEAGTKVTTLDSQKVDGTTWYKISFTWSGETQTGYVSGAYLKVTASSSDSSDPTSISGANATVTDGPLNVRKGYGTSYDVLESGGSRVQLAKGSRVKTGDSKTVSGTKWYKITFTWNGETLTGYVSGAFLKIDEEQIASKKAATGSSTEPQKPTNGKTIQVTEEEYDLLLRIVEAEAGDQSLKGRIMVANVIFNRVNSPKFPNTIKGVLEQPNQFTPVGNGRIYKVNPDATTTKAVDEALAGVDYAEGALFFCMKNSSTASRFAANYTLVAIEGDHAFFK